MNYPPIDVAFYATSIERPNIYIPGPFRYNHLIKLIKIH
jgi:hypothetical protein